MKFKDYQSCLSEALVFPFIKGQLISKCLIGVFNSPKKHLALPLIKFKGCLSHLSPFR